MIIVFTECDFRAAQTDSKLKFWRENYRHYKLLTLKFENQMNKYIKYLDFSSSEYHVSIRQSLTISGSFHELKNVFLCQFFFVNFSNPRRIRGESAADPPRIRGWIKFKCSFLAEKEKLAGSSDLRDVKGRKVT